MRERGGCAAARARMTRDLESCLDESLKAYLRRADEDNTQGGGHGATLGSGMGSLGGPGRYASTSSPPKDR